MVFITVSEARHVAEPRLGVARGAKQLVVWSLSRHGDVTNM